METIVDTLHQFHTQPERIVKDIEDLQKCEKYWEDEIMVGRFEKDMISGDTILVVTSFEFSNHSICHIITAVFKPDNSSTKIRDEILELEIPYELTIEEFVRFSGSFEENDFMIIDFVHLDDARKLLKN